MSAPAFGFASSHTALEAEDLIAGIPTPEDVSHALYSAVYNTIAEQIRACDGHDVEASVAHLLLCCDAIAQLATDIGGRLSAVHARIALDRDEEHLPGCVMPHARDARGRQPRMKDPCRSFPRFVPPIFPGRRGIHTDAHPEVVVIYRNVTVSHTYKYNAPPPDAEEWENHRYAFWYQVNGKQFDVRNVPGWFEEGRHIDILCDAIDAGIDLRWVGQQ